MEVPERMEVERKRRDWEVRGEVEGVRVRVDFEEELGEEEGERRDQIARMKASMEEVEARSSG